MIKPGTRIDQLRQVDDLEEFADYILFIAKMHDKKQIVAYLNEPMFVKTDKNEKNG